MQVTNTKLFFFKKKSLDIIFIIPRIKVEMFVETIFFGTGSL